MSRNQRKMEILDLDRSISFISSGKWEQDENKVQDTKRNVREEKEEADDRKLKDREKVEKYTKFAIVVHMYEFLDNFGMQGIRYVFMRNTTWFRRFIWLILVLTGTAYCWYLNLTSIKYYEGYPTTTKSKTVFQSKVNFPAVTVCNYNVFQKSKLSPQEIAMLYDMYRPYDLPVINSSKDVEYKIPNFTEFYHQKAFDYLSNIGLCSYKEVPCNRSLFYTRLRDVGVCVTFDPSKDPKFKYQSIAGKEGGLDIGLGILPQDWAPGPYMNLDGFIVYVHDPDTETIMIEDSGLSVPIGHTIGLGISKEVNTFLPPPYGQCGTKKLKYFSKYSKESCLLECETNHMIEHCQCKREYMPGNYNVTICTKRMELECKKEHYDGDSFDKENCGCPPDCEVTKYRVQMSLAKITEGSRNWIKEAFHGFDMVTSGVNIRVYYPSLMYTNNTQESTYSFEKLLCDIGGAAGLLLGTSFMTIAELGDFFCCMFWMLAVRFWKKTTKTEVKRIQPSKQ